MSAVEQPAAAAINLDAILGELRERPQWVAWLYGQRNGSKPTKVPYLPLPSRGRRASATDPATWGTFDDAVATLSWADGIGYVFSEDDPYPGIDLDNVLDDDGLIRDAIIAVWVMQLDSYTEVTPSGRGLHILVRGKLPGTKNRREFVELYDHARFFTITGAHVVGTPAGIQSRQAQLDLFYGDVFGLPELEQPAAPEPVQKPLAAVPAATRTGARSIPRDDDALLNGARTAQNGAKFRALYDHGRVDGGKSWSQADMALCNMLAFYTGGDADRIDRLFRRSALMRPKWADRADYREQTIGRAITDAHTATRTSSKEPDPPRGVRALGLPLVDQRILLLVREQEGVWRTTIPILMDECGAPDSTLRRRVQDLKTQGRITSEPVRGRSGGVVLGLTEKAFRP